MDFINIELGQTSKVVLRFRLESNPLAEVWLERFKLVTDVKVDHPARFYGFNSSNEEQQRAIKDITTYENH